MCLKEVAGLPLCNVHRHAFGQQSSFRGLKFDTRVLHPQRSSNYHGAEYFFDLQYEGGWNGQLRNSTVRPSSSPVVTDHILLLVNYSVAVKAGVCMCVWDCGPPLGASPPLFTFQPDVFEWKVPCVALYQTIQNYFLLFASAFLQGAG